MKKVLILASVASMIDQFNMPNIVLLKDMGYEVHVGCNFVDGSTCDSNKIEKLKEELTSLGVKFFHIDFSRSIINIKKNISSFRQTKDIMSDNEYEFVHAHSPIGGAIARVAGMFTKTKVIYTAHGFHFFKGAPIKNWLLFYPVEWLCSFMTDTLITINKEDFDFAKKHMHAKNIEYIPGIGVDTEKFKNTKIDLDKKRKELGLNKDDIMVLSVGELNDNKNHQIIINALSKINNSHIHYFIAGQGENKEKLNSLSKELNISENLHLLGFRTDVEELYKAADIFAFPSHREGLSVSVMEAMASGLPCVISKIRGNTDLIDENGGAFFNSKDVEDCKNAIENVLSKDLSLMGEYNQKKIESFDKKIVMEKTENIYSKMQ